MPTIPIAAPATVGLAATGALVWLVARYIRRSRSPEERERRRRIRLHVNGRLTEVTVYQADSSLLQYGYEIAGVAYETTQDISDLASYLPLPAEQLVGTAVAKYDPQNPANSIVMCEHWLGFKAHRPPDAAPTTPETALSPGSGESAVRSSLTERQN